MKTSERPNIVLTEVGTDMYQISALGYELIEVDGKGYLKRSEPIYPKTYEECKNIIYAPKEGECPDVPFYIKELGIPLIKLAKLLIVRNAYWKLYGNWEPDWLSFDPKYVIEYVYDNTIDTGFVTTTQKLLVFPTEKMRDEFLENFKTLIIQCRGLI